MCKDEFTSHFEQMLTFNEEEFDETMGNFVLVAEQVHLAKSRARAARLLNMDPIERAKYEAESYTKDADIDIFKARQEEVAFCTLHLSSLHSSPIFFELAHYSHS